MRRKHKIMIFLVLLLTVLNVTAALSVSEEEDVGEVISVVKRDSYIEDGLYGCHAKMNVMKASDLHEAAEERIKTVFRRKRQAEETDVDEEETDADGLKILSSRTNQVLQMKQKVQNYTARHAAAVYCLNKKRFLSKGIAKEVGCAEQTSGSTLHILCLYRVEF
ncbi:hypothetical protein ACHWQZ_G017972 [Mnemiopsis leidyi]